MSAKRKPRLPVPVRPKSNGVDSFLDRVSLAGVKTYKTFTDDIEPEMSVVQTGRSARRQPRDLYNPPNVINIFELNPGTRLIPLGKKWCSNCGDWVDLKGFSEDKRNRDGLQPHCKTCRNAHARRMYWIKKDSAVGVPIAA